MKPSRRSHSVDADRDGQRAEPRFVAGLFCGSFDDGSAGRAAAIDARAAGFVVDLHETRAGAWAIEARRKEPFPSDEQRRYEAKLRGIVTRHGGTYDRFLADESLTFGGGA